MTPIPHGLRVETRGASLEITALAADLFRLTRFPRGQSAPPSWAVLPLPPISLPPVPGPVVPETPIRLSTREATWTLHPTSGEWSLHDAHGLELFRATPPGPASSSRSPLNHLTLALLPREQLFGLGETTGPLNKRGLIKEFWNIDVLGHAPAIHPGLRNLYVSIPFALSLRDGRAAGLFWDCPARQTWDLGATHTDQWTLSADSPGLDLYLFTGPSPARVVERFTELTGRIPLPPRWALGYQQCRYSYTSRTELERVATEFRRRQLPCDVLYCDIHHLDGYRVFTFGKTYPKPGQMIAQLRRRGFKVVTIVDPGVKDDPRFGTLVRGRRLQAFVRDPQKRRDALGEVWPGRSRFPDFLHQRVRDWWGDEQRALVKLGVAGVWNDMNEPANFARPDKTLDPECRHRTDHGPRRHREVHNAYGSQMARASFDGLRRHRPTERPFVVTRAGYAGVQRFAAVWTGDNSSCWEHLGEAVRQCLGLGLSGVPFCGADVGGFLEQPSPELFVRWLQAALFAPFLRNHSNIGTPAQEPWAFGPEVEAISRSMLNLRYQLIPYLYSLMARAAQDGTPPLRPLLWEFPNDALAVACQDQFLLGASLLVAPILQPGAVARSVYLPRGTWFDFWTGQSHHGGTHVLAEAPLHRLPLYARAGALIPMVPPRPSIGTRESATVFLHHWPGPGEPFTWYDDDGRTERYRDGAWQRRVLHAHSTPRSGRLHLHAASGHYTGQTRSWRVILRARSRGGHVRLNGEILESEWAPELRLQSFTLPAIPEAQHVTWS